MRNRIRNAWDAIDDEGLRRKVAQFELERADRGRRLLSEGASASLRVIVVPYPGASDDSKLALLVLYVADLPLTQVGQAKIV